MSDPSNAEYHHSKEAHSSAIMRLEAIMRSASDDELLAESNRIAQVRDAFDGFDLSLYYAIVSEFCRRSQDERVVLLLSAVFPRRPLIGTGVEFRLARESPRSVDILRRAYEKATDPLVRKDIESGFRRAFPNVNRPELDGPQVVAAAVQWYGEHRNKLRPNPMYELEPRAGLFENADGTKADR